MSTHKHLYRLKKALIVEIHVIFYCLYLFNNILCQKLGQWGKLLSVGLVEDDHQASRLL